MAQITRIFISNMFVEHSPPKAEGTLLHLCCSSVKSTVVTSLLGKVKWGAGGVKSESFHTSQIWVVILASSFR